MEMFVTRTINLDKEELNILKEADKIFCDLFEFTDEPFYDNGSVICRYIIARDGVIITEGEEV